MKNKILFLIISLLFFIDGVFSKELPLVPYTSDNGYSIEFPKEWEVEGSGDDFDAAAFSPAENEMDKTFENVQVFVEPLDSPLTLEEYTQQSIENLKRKFTGLIIVDQGNQVIDHVPAKWFRANITSEKIRGEILQYQMIVDQRVYIINFAADPATYSRFAPTFEKIASSFRFTPALE